MLITYYLNSINFKLNIRFIVFAILLISFLTLLSQYRDRIRRFDFSNFTSENDLGVNAYMNQFRSFLADASVVKYKREGGYEYDMGVTMFGYYPIIILPKALFPNGRKPYPPPSVEINAMAYKTVEGYYSGEAVSGIGDTFIAFGYFGWIVFLIWGRLARNIAVGFVTSRNIIPLSIFLIAFFQYFTRGYLPSTLVMVTFFLIPFILKKILDFVYAK